MRICAVCSGNICRSPFVEYVLRRELGEEHPVCSAGTLGIFGSAAYEECVRLGPKYGINLGPHRSQGLTTALVSQCDLLVVMTGEHCQATKKAGAAEEKVKLLSDYLPEGTIYDVGKLGTVRKGQDLPDPMGMAMSDVRPVLDVLELAATGLAKEIRRTHGKD